MNIKKDFGKRIKELRTKSHLTQEKFAELTGIDPKHVSHVETGRSFPKADLIEKMAKVLEVDYKIFFVNNEKKSRKEIQKDLLSIIKKLSDKEIETLYKVVSAGFLS